MKLWLTAAEIAAAALPGLPETRRGVQLLAEREDWARFRSLCRERAGRGGGVEYHVNLLTTEARAAYYGATGPGSAPGEALQAAPEAPVAGRAAAELDARLAVLGAFRAFARASDLKQTGAVICFVDLFNLGRADVPAWARAAVPRLSTRTLQRWLVAAREGDTQRLAVDRGAARRGQGVLDTAFDGEIKHFSLAVHSFNELYTARQIYETLRGEFAGRLAGAGLALPCQRAFELRFGAWKREHAAGLLRMMDPDGFRSKMRTSGSCAHLVPHLNALWQIDASPVDALCIDGRHSIYVCVDVWSRRLVLHVSRTPRSAAVQLLMRKAILAWGVPDAVKTDNGSDFVATATTRLFAKLRIEPILSEAFQPWQKGVVERHIRTFQTDCARMLTGFVGHSVAHRKRIEGRKSFAQRLGQDENAAFNVTMTGEELQGLVDRWAGELYAQRAHGGIGNLTPFARAASSTRPIRTVDADALASLLMPAPDAQGLRTVGKSGVRVAGWHYLTPGILPGQTVFVRLDPADKGVIWLFDETGDRFLGRGVNAELAGVDPAELLARTREAQKAAIDAQMAEVKQLTKKRVTERTVLDGRLAAAAIESGKLVQFPQRSEPHSTPALDAGLEIAAIRRGDVFAPTPVDPGLHAEIEADIADLKVTPLRIDETPHQRFRRARLLEVRMADGEPLATADALWLGGYQSTPEYRAHASIEADFKEFGGAA